MPHARVSRLRVAGELVRGHVDDCPGPQEVHLYLDGRHVATEWTLVGAAGGGGRLNFTFRLPPAALDGHPHDLHAALPRGTAGPVHGAVVRHRAPGVRGSVRQHGGHFMAVVLAESPAARCVVKVFDDGGRVVAEQAGDASTSPGAHEGEPGYLAQMSFEAATLPDGLLRFACEGRELAGSPCRREQTLVGIVERADWRVVHGWAFDGSEPGRPVELVLRVDGRNVAWFRPNLLRGDIAAHLRERDQDMGLVGFSVRLPEWVNDGGRHLVEVAAATTGDLLKDGRRHVQSSPPRALLTPAGHGARRPADARRARQVPRVSAIILNRNGAGLLSALFESWHAHNRTVPVQLIVIDHASTDDSLAVIDAWKSRLDVRAIARRSNRSFSESSNLGARKARGEHLLFLNNDIVWLQDALPAMLESLAHPDVGIVGMKLLKVVAEGRATGGFASEVQHLGVRFTVGEDAYWPYEASGPREDEHNAQDVPAVTGAALLCRRRDFLAVGGFDEGFFYGFEDVELCLRLAQSLGLRTVCRNDVVALHHHGHTRLSGRALSIFERLRGNSAVLQRRAGPWLRQACWRSLVQGDGYLAREALTIGIALDVRVSLGERSALADDARAFAARLHAALPHANIVAVEPGNDWKRVEQLHVLLVPDTGYDVRSLQHARADLLCIAWVRRNAAAWPGLAWWDEFDAALIAPGLDVPAASSVAPPIHRSTARRPLGELLCDRAWRLRIAIDGRAGADPQQVRALQAHLRQDGAVCWIEGDSPPFRRRMADLRLVPGKRMDRPRVADDGSLRVTWRPDRPLPDLASLARVMESCIGNTFPAP